MTALALVSALEQNTTANSRLQTTISVSEALWRWRRSSNIEGLREIFVTAYTTASEFGIDPAVVAGRLSEEHQR
jgi:hypothetical protein